MDYDFKTADTDLMVDMLADKNKLVSPDRIQYYQHDDEKLDDDLNPNTLFTKNQNKNSVQEENKRKDSVRNDRKTVNLENESTHLENTKYEKTTKETDDDDWRTWDRRKLNQKKLTVLRDLGGLVTQGVILSQNYSMESNYDDMIDELNLHKSVRSKIRGMKMINGGLISFIKGVEWLNDKYDPFDMKFNGEWSKDISNNPEDFYDSTSELVDKYLSRMDMSPELNFLIAVVMSGAGALKRTHGSDNPSSTIENEELIALRRKAEATEKLRQRVLKEHEMASKQAEDMRWVKKSMNEYEVLQKHASDRNTVNNLKSGLVMSDTTEDRYNSERKTSTKNPNQTDEETRFNNMMLLQQQRQINEKLEFIKGQNDLNRYEAMLREIDSPNKMTPKITETINSKENNHVQIQRPPIINTKQLLISQDSEDQDTIEDIVNIDDTANAIFKQIQEAEEIESTVSTISTITRNSEHSAIMDKFHKRNESLSNSINSKSKTLNTGVSKRSMTSKGGISVGRTKRRK